MQPAHRAGRVDIVAAEPAPVAQQRILAHVAAATAPAAGAATAAAPSRLASLAVHLLGLNAMLPVARPPSSAITRALLTAALDGAEVVYNLGVDEGDIPAGPVVIYQGSHGDRGAHRADIILPGAAYTEENGLFVNTEGRPQLAMRAGFAPGDAKENWAILRALSAELNATLPFDSLSALRSAIVTAHPHLGDIDAVAQNTWTLEKAKKPNKAPFVYAINDFYLPNPIARASQLMAELSANAKARANPAVAAE